MDLQWNLEKEKLYQSFIDEKLRMGCTQLSFLGATLFPLFSLLDYYTQHQNLRELLTIRYITTVLFVAIYIACKKGRLLNKPYYTASTQALVASLGITLMCMLQGGSKSPYYAGINLVILAALVVLPLQPKKMFSLVALCTTIYFVGIAFVSGFDIRNDGALLNNLYFVISTGIIGIVGSHFTNNIRRESFLRLIELEQAQSNLKRSKEILQLDLKSEQGNVEVLIKEITERKAQLEAALSSAQEAQERAQQAMQLREEFISLASHELNTPLTSLKLQTQMIQRKLQLNPMDTAGILNKLLITYDSQLKRLIRLVNDMLDISRISAGKLELEKNEVDLVNLVKEVIERASEHLEEKKIPMDLKFDQVVHVNCDSFRVEQVVLNLITNAIKYGGGSPIQVEVRRVECMAEVRVTDKGIGVAPESISRIFKRFERAVNKREISGLGLGLYICRQIIIAHDGHIHVESELGEGSTFSFMIPAIHR